MTFDPVSAVLVQPMAAQLSVPDLIRSVEVLKQSGPEASVGALYSAWIERHPKDPLLYAVLFNFAVWLTDAQQLEPARVCLDRAVALNPEFMPAYINLGRVYERLWNVGLALAHWSAALVRMAAITGPAITHKT